MPEVATPNQAEREFETGSDEFFKNQSEMNAANVKRTYDVYQNLELETAHRSRLQFDQLQNIALQALQNSVETSNMVSKQAVRHADLAIDRQWNVDEQGYTVEEILGNSTFKDAIRAAVAEITAKIAK